MLHRSTTCAIRRRELLRAAFFTAGALAAGPLLSACGASPRPTAGIGPGRRSLVDAGPLQAPDASGLRLPEGFRSRVVAVSGLPPVAGSGYLWHPFPDGGATFATPDGGWIYVSNSEVQNTGLVSGGVGALRFDADGNLVDAYPILTGTDGNCAGGKTPWQTWLSCEEPQNTPNAPGLVWECDPFTRGSNGVARPALGIFKHEAVCVDPVERVLYLTEDTPDGRFYRFVPSASDWPAGAERPALQQGRLQVLRFADGGRGQSLDEAGLSVDEALPVVWEDVSGPDQPQSVVRAGLGADAPGSRFSGGEGIWYLNGVVYFSTKGDDRIWAYEPATGLIQVIYDFATADHPILSGVDNLTVTEFGDVLVAEDGGDMQLVVIGPDGRVAPLLQAADQTGSSELAGPAFSPDGTRLYVSAMRNGQAGAPGQGITFEILLPYSVCPSGQCPP